MKNKVFFWLGIFFIATVTLLIASSIGEYSPAAIMSYEHCLMALVIMGIPFCLGLLTNVEKL